jgi:hypothetical protein
VEDVTERFRAAFDAELEDDVKEARARFTARRWPWKSKPPA